MIRLLVTTHPTQPIMTETVYALLELEDSDLASIAERFALMDGLRSTGLVTGIFNAFALPRLVLGDPIAIRLGAEISAKDQQRVDYWYTLTESVHMHGVVRVNNELPQLEDANDVNEAGDIPVQIADCATVVDSADIWWRWLIDNCDTSVYIETGYLSRKELAELLTPLA